jgi:diadenosine tetraphosphate (Ap4A) HIT family hydrolase
MDRGCEVCHLLEARERGDDPYAIALVETGSISLLPTQYYEGYTVFSAKQCVPELHELEAVERDQYLHEMALVAEAVFRAFSPRKLNYELLGNGTAHLHWHLVPRHADDPKPGGPIWEDLNFLRTLGTGGAQPAPARRVELKARLLSELERTGLVIERRY